jgi:hypothetical protein
MDWAIYGALIAAFLANIAAWTHLVVRALRGWRDFRRFRRHLGKELATLADHAEATVEKLETAGDTRELDESISRLRVSLARLAVLRGAIDETTGTARGYLAYVPRA